MNDRITTDPTHPNLTRGADADSTGQAKTYLVLSDEERAKGFVRPYRDTYVHLRMENGDDPPRVLITRKGTVGCGAATKMAREIAETYARDPEFYSNTYCVGCSKHLPVEQFSWDPDNTAVGS